MKRSEMLAIIWEAINELEDADHILTRLEKEGMLPPQAEFHTRFSDWDGESSTVHTVVRREWEKE